MKHDIRGNSEGNEKQIDTFFVKINQIFFPILKSIDFAIFIYFFVTFYKYAIIFFLFLTLKKQDVLQKKSALVPLISSY